jgi:hypothetical protein
MNKLNLYDEIIKKKQKYFNENNKISIMYILTLLKNSLKISKKHLSNKIKM